MINNSEIPSTLRKTCASTKLFVTKPIWTDLTSNVDNHGKKLVASAMAQQELFCFV